MRKLLHETLMLCRSEEGYLFQRGGEQPVLTINNTTPFMIQVLYHTRRVSLQRAPPKRFYSVFIVKLTALNHVCCFSDR